MNEPRLERKSFQRLKIYIKKIILRDLVNFYLKLIGRM